VFDYAEMGALDRAARAIDGYERLARDLRQPRHLWPERMMRAMMALGAGRFDEAARLRDEALERAGGLQDVAVMLTFAFHSWGRALVTELPADLMRAEDDLLRSERELAVRFGHQSLGHTPQDIWLLCGAALHARAGDRDAARRKLTAVPPTVTSWSTICWPSPSWRKRGVAGRSGPGGGAFPAAAGGGGARLHIGRTGMVFVGAIEGPLGIYAHVTGRHAEARAYLEKAVQMERAAG